MVSVRDRLERIGESRLKIRPPGELDETLCLYSPQDNVDALNHPRIRDWFDFLLRRYQPVLPAGEPRILLLMPCTKTKPYPLSTEHVRINQALTDAGFVPVGGFEWAPLRDAAGTVVHRVVLSEPLALVPYEHILAYEGKASPASCYDDPGLFEHRGNAVSPWRPDSTAVPVNEFRWAWGNAERRAYVEMHNEMARLVALVLDRLAGWYDRRIAWVAPGLTHRSFVVGADERRAHGVVSTRRVGGALCKLLGANDLLPEALRIACLPSLAQCRDARGRLAARLGCEVAKVGGVYSRGGGDATPLALPELLEHLIKALRA